MSLTEYTISKKKEIFQKSSSNDTLFPLLIFIFTLAAFPSSSDSSKLNESSTAGAPGLPLGFGFGIGFGLGLSSPESAAANVPFLGAALES